jgi:hypothetical protein
MAISSPNFPRCLWFASMALNVVVWICIDIESCGYSCYIFMHEVS